MAPKKGIEKKSGEKKALSGYMKYCAEKRAEWKKAGKVVPVPEQGKTLGAGWKAMSDAQKAKYK